MKLLTILSVLLLTFSSCATILGGEITDYQHAQLRKDEKRRLRPGYVAVNILLPFPALLIDLNTGAIYKPVKKPANE